MKDAANGQLQVDGINRALQHHAISQLPAKLLGQFVVHDRPCPVALPCGKLVGRYLHLREDFRKLIGIGAELREKVFRLVILI